MYLPLKFLNQMDSFIQLPQNRYLEGYVNRRSLEYVDSLGEDKILKMYIRKDMYTDEEGYISKDKLEELVPIIQGYQEYTGGAIVTDVNDFFDQLLCSNIRNQWGRYKLAYKVDSALLKTLSEMELPEFFSADVLARVPASCFYVDFGEECPFCEDAKGFFVNIHADEDSIDIALVSLIDSERTIPFISRSGLVFEEGQGMSDVKVTVNITNSMDYLLENFEDGKSRTLRETKFFNFFYNFMLYLQAANRDVEISESTKAVYKERKPGATPKNQFKEVKQLEVGFRYGKKIKAGQVKTVAEKGNVKDEERTPRPISSHYRSAHWHHYWKGSGENKELIIKWVEGVFVQGTKESNTVVVHKVE